jgi:hypothetical protein
MHLKKWSAKRSGAGMRVTGFDTQSQRDAKVQCVEISRAAAVRSLRPTRTASSMSSPRNSQHFNSVPVCAACRDRKWHAHWCDTCRAETATTRVPGMIN